MEVKKKILESCTLPVLTYGSQTWAITEAQNLKLGRIQIAMEPSLAGIKWRDKMRITYIKELTGAKDCTFIFKKLKFDYAGHLARERRISGKDGCWNDIQGKESGNREGHQLVGKVKIIKHTGILWGRNARVRNDGGRSGRFMLGNGHTS